MERIIVASGNRHKIEEIADITRAFGLRAVSEEEAGVPAGFDVKEDGKTFEENSRKKAEAVVRLTGEPAIADDSGLMVDYLGGAPGVYSARFSLIEDCPVTAEEEKRELQIGVESEEHDCHSAGVRQNGAYIVSGYVPDSEGHPRKVAAAFSSAGTGENRVLSTDEANNRKLLRLLDGVPPEERRARFVSVITMAWPGGRIYTARGECPGMILTECRGTGGFGYDPLFVPGGYDRTFAELSQEVKNRISHRARALRELERLLNESVSR